VLGHWNTLEDVNTLIDVGRDPSIILRIISTHTGVGKKRIEQVILTHNHYDHTSLLPLIKEKFDPRIYAFSENIPGVDHLLKDGDKIQVGNSMVEVIHTPLHTTDSVCLYCEEDSILFSGDTPLLFNSTPVPDNEQFIESLKELAKRRIRIIYGGHGDPVRCKCNQRISEAIQQIENRKV
jgi:glyoxylase-like metal-dependent hydrolase (beta-lactamase superfamily II)